MKTPSVKERILRGIERNGHHVEPLVVLLSTDFQTEYRPGGKRGQSFIKEWCREHGLEQSELIIHVGNEQQIGVRFEPVEKQRPELTVELVSQ